MTRFKVSCVCEGAKLSLIFDLLKDDATEISVSQIEGDPSHMSALRDRKGRPISPASHRKRPAFDTCLDYVRKVHPSVISSVPTGPLGDALEAAGFNRTSASSICTDLVRTGYLRRVAQGQVETTGKA